MEPPSAHNSHEIIYATTPHQNQNFVYTTTSVNSTDATVVATPLEGNATTTTTIFAQPNAETYTFNAYEGGDLNVHNDPKVGNEYVVMADGSVENVMGKGNRI